ncbi:MAG TPA: acyltransferase domain-containing protein [Phycisphaerae bacterium]|nr:acyltransferase domain-containing protein [Phycisphaerae bacterium]
MSRPRSFDETMDALALGEQRESWRAGWAEGQATYPPDGPEFLRERFVRETCATLEIPDDVREAVVESLAAFEALPTLKRLAWHCHCVLFGREPGGIEELCKAAIPWPTRPEQLPAWGEAFYPAVLLSGGPYMMDLHRRRGVPMDVTRDTTGDLPLWMRHYRERTGRWGLAEAGWLANHFRGRIYKLGRLQFRFEEFAYGFGAFRSAGDGRVVLLAPGGVRFRRDGQFDGAGGARDAEGAWTSTFSDDGGVLRGHPVSSDGRALPRAVELPKATWRPVLQQGDAILGVHIPATGPMSHAACGESFLRAAAFFPEHFPEFAWGAFVCTSWFLDNQFARLLPETSNIRRFQQEVQLFPLPGASDSQTFERVFGGRPADIERAPRDTILRRAIVEHVRAGGHFHAGGCVLFRDGLDWGGGARRPHPGPHRRGA